MSTPLDRWCELSELFTKRLSEVRPEQWAASTPCEEWDVRALAVLQSCEALSVNNLADLAVVEQEMRKQNLS